MTLVLLFKAPCFCKGGWGQHCGSKKKKKETTLRERGWESSLSIPNHVADDLKISPDTHGTEDGLYLRKDESLKNSLESSSEPLEGTSERPVGDVTQELAQKRRLDPSPQVRSPLGKAARTRRMRKSPGKEKEKPRRPAFSQHRSEGDAAAGEELSLLGAREHQPGLPDQAGWARGCRIPCSTHRHNTRISRSIMARHSTNAFLPQIPVLSGSRMEAEGRGHGSHKPLSGPG